MTQTGTGRACRGACVCPSSKVPPGSMLKASGSDGNWASQTKAKLKADDRHQFIYLQQHFRKKANTHPPLVNQPQHPCRPVLPRPLHLSAPAVGLWELPEAVPQETSALLSTPSMQVNFQSPSGTTTRQCLDPPHSEQPMLPLPPAPPTVRIPGLHVQNRTQGSVLWSELPHR